MNLFYSMSEKLFFYVRHSICEEGVDLTMKKVSLRIEDEILKMLMLLCGTDNVSEVVEAFTQSGCNIFIDLFCGSLAMLCYLPWVTKVVVNDINGNLANLYKVIRDKPSAFIREVM